jgi:hypothetical protein
VHGDGERGGGLEWIARVLGEGDEFFALLPRDARGDVEVDVDAALRVVEVGADAVVGGDLGEGP